MRPNQVMFIYKPQLKDVKSRKETTLQISARNTNSRKIAANTVFSVLGNSDVQRGLLKIRVMACGSECPRFESVRAPKRRHRFVAVSFFCEQRYKEKSRSIVENSSYNFSPLCLL